MKKRMSGHCALLPIAAALALTVTTIGSNANAAASGTPLAKTTTTNFAFNGSGYGSRVIGGQIPAGSGTTAYQVIGCTNQAGKDKTNNVDNVVIPGFGTETTAKTHVWTRKANGVASSYSTEDIASVTLGASPLGSLALTAISSVSRAYHDSSGYHATASTSLGGITLTPTVGPPQNIPVPAPGQSVTVPGLATIYLGKSVTRNDDNAALAYAIAVTITVPGSSSKVTLAKSQASIAGGLRYGTFQGHSDAIQVTSTNTPSITSGRNPLSVMPCQGTNGVVKRKAIAGVNLGGQLIVNGLASAQKGNQTDHRAHGWERGTVAGININDQIVVQAIVGQVNVDRRDGHKIVRNIKGTTLGTITVNGQTQVFEPGQNVIEIPGLVRFERNVQDRSKTGVSVIALRITLLSGTLGVIDLGEASLHISKLKRR